MKISRMLYTVLGCCSSLYVVLMSKTYSCGLRYNDVVG